MDICEEGKVKKPGPQANLEKCSLFQKRKVIMINGDL